MTLKLYRIFEWHGRYFWNIEEYNPETEHKTLIVFKDMIGDIISDQNLNPTVTKLFIRGKK